MWCDFKKKWVRFRHNLWIDIFSQEQILEDLDEAKRTLVQAQDITWTIVDQNPRRHSTHQGHNELMEVPQESVC